MNTVSRFQDWLARLQGLADKVGRNAKEIAIALRVLTGLGTRARRSTGGEAEMFTGGDADWVNNIQELAQLGVSAVDVRLFCYGADQSLDAMIGNMHRFRDECWQSSDRGDAAAQHR